MKRNAVLVKIVTLVLGAAASNLLWSGCASAPSEDDPAGEENIGEVPQAVAGCNKVDQFCCTDANNNLFCSGGLTCVFPGVCRDCGQPNAPCCPGLGGPFCQDKASLICDNGTCKQCGGDGQPCCFRDPPCKAGLTCNSGTCS